MGEKFEYEKYEPGSWQLQLLRVGRYLSFRESEACLSLPACRGEEEEEEETKLCGRQLQLRLYTYSHSRDLPLLEVGLKGIHPALSFSSNSA